MAPDSKSGDLPDLLKRYVRQETVEPLRSLGRFLGLGLAGSILMGGGAVLLGIGALRLLQEWSVLNGRWSWAPYLMVAAGLLASAAFAGSRISGRHPLGEKPDR